MCACIFSPLIILIYWITSKVSLDFKLFSVSNYCPFVHLIFLYNAWDTYDISRCTKKKMMIFMLVSAVKWIIQNNPHNSTNLKHTPINNEVVLPCLVVGFCNVAWSQTSSTKNVSIYICRNFNFKNFVYSTFHFLQYANIQSHIYKQVTKHAFFNIYLFLFFFLLKCLCC